MLCALSFLPKLCRSYFQEMIKKAFGGILLVDEAYYLYNAANDKDYGQESIEILLNVMEEQKDDLIVTLAGCVYGPDLAGLSHVLGPKSWLATSTLG